MIYIQRKQPSFLLNGAALPSASHFLILPKNSTMKISRQKSFIGQVTSPGVEWDRLNWKSLKHKIERSVSVVKVVVVVDKRPSIKVKISLQLISMKCQFLCRRRRRRCRRQQMIGLWIIATNVSSLPYYFLKYTCPPWDRGIEINKTFRYRKYLHQKSNT